VLTVGLPVERHERLLKVDRLRDGGSVTAWIPWYFQASGRLSPTVSGEESRWILRDWRVWGALQSRGVTGGGNGIRAGFTLFSAGKQRVTKRWIRDPGYFCGKTPPFSCFRRGIGCLGRRVIF
jgi:hypothetical protein